MVRPDSPSVPGVRPPAPRSLGVNLFPPFAGPDLKRRDLSTPEPESVRPWPLRHAAPEWSIYRQSRYHIANRYSPQPALTLATSVRLRPWLSADEYPLTFVPRPGPGPGPRPVLPAKGLRAGAASDRPGPDQGKAGRDPVLRGLEPATCRHWLAPYAPLPHPHAYPPADGSKVSTSDSEHLPLTPPPPPSRGPR